VNLEIETLEVKIRDQQAQLAAFSVEYGDQQMVLTKIAENMSRSEGELNALTTRLRTTLEDHARARAIKITRETDAQLEAAREELKDLAAELQKAKKAAEKLTKEKEEKAEKAAKKAKKTKDKKANDK
jgi:glycine cleavage system regulatory protein